MPFVQRDALNRVAGKWTVQQFEGQEFLPDGHPDLVFVETAEEKDSREVAEVDSAFQLSRVQRLIFLIELDQENRIRALEGRPAITTAQYRDALIVRYKVLNG